MSWKLLALLYLALHFTFGCKTTTNNSLKSNEIQPLSELNIKVSCRQMAEIFDYFSGQFGSFFCSKEHGEVISPEVTSLKMLAQDGSASVKQLLNSLLNQRTALLSNNDASAHQASRTISKAFIQVKDQNPCYTPWNLQNQASPEAKASKTTSNKSKCPDSAALLKKVMQALQ